MTDDGQWHRYGMRVDNGVTNHYCDNKWTHSDPHPSLWHPIKRWRSKRHVAKQAGRG